MKQTKGFTLLELLVSAAIMIVILGALGGLFTTTVRANRTTTRASEAQQNAEAAIQLLKSEIGLAGYRGTDSTANSRTFSSSTLVVTPETTTRDRIGVRFFEDRYVSGITQRMVTFGINTDTKELTRKLDAGDSLAVVEGVTNLKVTNYLLKGNVTSPTISDGNKVNLRGITVRLTFADSTSRNVAIALNNTQQ
jgi:Tfp pilus assembly protein PilW